MDCLIYNNGAMRVTAKPAVSSIKFEQGIEQVIVGNVTWEMAQQLRAALDALFPLVPGELAVASA